MFKKLKFIEGVKLDLDGQVEYVGNKKPTLIEDGSYLHLFISGRWRTYSRSWLGLIAHYEYDLGADHLDNVRFVKCSSPLLRFRCGFLMQFKKPVYFKPGFRIVPGLTRYAVSENGDVVSTFSGKQLASRSIGPYGYPMTSCYDPDKSRYRQVCTHILVGRAWCKNNFPEQKIVLNHKDGVKTNIHRSNLEWATCKSNVGHAVETGLTSDNKRCFVYDLVTDTKTEFLSITNATKVFWSGKGNAPAKKWLHGRFVPRVYKDRYVIIEDGEDVVDVVREARETKDIRITGPYQALNIETMEVLESATSRELGEKCGLPKSVVEHGLKLPPATAYKGFLFRQKSDEEWPTHITSRKVKTSRKLKLVCKKTGKTHTYPSISQATDFLKCDKTTISRRIENGEELNGFFIKEIV